MSLTVWVGAKDPSEHNPHPNSLTSINLKSVGKTALSVASHCASTLGVPKDVRECFSIYYVAKEGWTHMFADSEEVLPDLNGDYIYRRNTLRAAEETKLMKHDATIDILFAEAAAAVAVNELGGDAEQLDKLDEYADPAFLVKRQYVQIAQECNLYSTIPSYKCIVLPEESDDAPINSIGLVPGYADISLSFEGISLKRPESDEVLLELNRIRSWSFPQGQQNLNRVLQSGAPMSFSFEYYSKSKVFFWVRLSTAEGMSLPHQLQRIVPQLFRDQQGAQWPTQTKSELAAASKSDKRKTKNYLFGF